LVCFFYQIYAPHRDLHSFPTRRSSDLAWHWETGKLLSDFVVEPKVTLADIELTDFDLKKVSKIEGWAAHELGEGFKHTLAKKLRSEEHTSELQSRSDLVCRLLLEKKKK